MEYQFAHEPDTLLGRLEREWHGRFLISTDTLELFPRNVASELIDTHAFIEEAANSWVICRDINGSVVELDDLRRQLGQRLTEARIKQLRAKPGEEKARWDARVSIFTQAFGKVAEGMGASYV